MVIEALTLLMLGCASTHRAPDAQDAARWDAATVAAPGLDAAAPSDAPARPTTEAGLVRDSAPATAADGGGASPRDASAGAAADAATTPGDAFADDDAGSACSHTLAASCPDAGRSKPTRDQVLKAMAAIKGDVNACATLELAGALVHVSITWAPTGCVESVLAEDPGEVGIADEVLECVANAVMQAVVPPFCDEFPFRIKYPLRLGSAPPSSR